jgi:hypothetical protein
LFSSRFLEILTPIGKGWVLGLLLNFLYFCSILSIKLLCVIIRDLLDLFLIISTPKNSFISPKLVISNLEVLDKSLYRLLTSDIFKANTNILSTCVANIIGSLLYINTLLSIFKLVNSSFSRILVKNNCYCLLACFKLYKALFNLQARSL